MPDFALEPAERQFLAALNELGVRYLIVGVTAASMQGARVATEANRPKDRAALPALEAALAVERDERERDPDA